MTTVQGQVILRVFFYSGGRPKVLIFLKFSVKIFTVWSLSSRFFSFIFTQADPTEPTELNDPTEPVNRFFLYFIN